MSISTRPAFRGRVRGAVAGDHRVVVVEADVQQVGVPADDVALLVQPARERPVGLVHRDLLHPALQGNVAEGNAGAFGAAPSTGGGLWGVGCGVAWWVSPRGAVVAGRPPGAEAGGQRACPRCWRFAVLRSRG